MTGETRDGRERQEVDSDLPPPVRMPRWVPVVIGLALVAMAALAIWTGLRQRDVPFWKAAAGSSTTRSPQVGVPGEPEPGASRVVHGAGGDVIPQPGVTDPSQRARMVITGDSSGVTPTVRVDARRGLLVDVNPEDAIVYVNDQLIGEARQFAARQQAWEFAEPQGSYHVVVIAQGYRPLQYEVIANPDSTNELAVVRGDLEIQ